MQAMVLPLAARQLLLERQPLRTHGPGPLLPGLLAAPVGGVTLALVQVRWRWRMLSMGPHERDVNA